MRKQPEQKRQFLAARDRIHDLLNALGDQVLRIDFDHERFPHPASSEAQDFRGQRGAEKHCLALRWRRQPCHDPAHVGNEPHVQHAVRFVDHQDRGLGQGQDALAHIVDQSARGRGDDIHAGPQLGPLLVVVHAAVHGHVPTIAVGTEPGGIAIDLNRQFPGGRQNQCERLVSLPIAAALGQEPLQDRDQEGSRLAGAGLGASGHVLPGQCRWQRLGLNGCAAGEFQVFQHGAQDPLVQPEILEPGAAVRRTVRRRDPIRNGPARHGRRGLGRGKNLLSRCLRRLCGSPAPRPRRCRTGPLPPRF